jgi:hypothetical protein
LHMTAHTHTSVRTQEAVRNWDGLFFPTYQSAQILLPQISTSVKVGSDDKAVEEWLRVQNSHSYKEGIGAPIIGTGLLKFMVIMQKNVVCGTSFCLSYECVKRIM